MNTPTVTPDAISVELKQRPQWVCWRYAIRNGKATKIPLNAITGKGASSTAPETWTDFDTAIAAFNADGGFDGVGYVFAPDDPYCGVDIDNCLIDGKPEPWAQEIIDTFIGAYIEVSPSGNGVKIFGKGRIPGEHRVGTIDGHKIEMYHDGRFFTVTGNRLNQGVTL